MIDESVIDIVEKNEDDSTQIAEQARALGWVSKDEFTKDPDKWVDAKDFLESHAGHNGALRRALEKQSSKIEALEKQLKNVDAAHKSIFAAQLKKAQDEFDLQIDFIKQQRKEARKNGDFETADQLDEQLEAVQKKGPDLPTSPAAQPDWRQNKTLSDWADQNPWFDDPKLSHMTNFAVEEGRRIKAENPSMPYSELLLEVTASVKKEFPHRFNDTPRKSMVEAATPQGNNSSGPKNTYAALTKEAKAECDSAVRDGMKQADWVRLYFEYEDMRKGKK